MHFLATLDSPLRLLPGQYSLSGVEHPFQLRPPGELNLEVGESLDGGMSCFLIRLQLIYMSELTVQNPYYFCSQQSIFWNGAFLGAQMVRRRQWQPTPVLLPGKSHGRRSLVGYTVHGVARSRTQLSDFTFTFHFHALEKEMATHSSTLAWKIPGTEEPGRLPSMGSHRVGHDWSDLAAAATADGKESSLQGRKLGSIPGSGRSPWRREWQPTPVFLLGEFQRNLAGNSPWGRTVRHDWATNIFTLFTAVHI